MRFTVVLVRDRRPDVLQLLATMETARPRREATHDSAQVSTAQCSKADLEDERLAALSGLCHDGTTVAGHEALGRSTLLPPGSTETGPRIALAVGAHARRCSIAIGVRRTGMEERANDARLASAHPHAQVVELGGRKRRRQLAVVLEIGDVCDAVE